MFFFSYLNKNNFFKVLNWYFNPKYRWVKNMNREIVEYVLENNKPKRKVLKNAICAFIYGGVIAVMGESLIVIYQKGFKFDEKTSIALMATSLILVASIFTGLGIYDKIGQVAGAGTIVPITGFSNSMTSSALESKSEGLVLGILTNMFKLAGAVIAAGVVSAFIFGTIIYIGRLL